MKISKKLSIWIAIPSIVPFGIIASSCNNDNNPTDKWFKIQKLDFESLPWPRIYYEFDKDVKSLSQKSKTGSIADIGMTKRLSNTQFFVEINHYFDHDDIVTVTFENETKKLNFKFDHKTKEYSIAEME